MQEFRPNPPYEWNVMFFTLKQKKLLYNHKTFDAFLDKHIHSILSISKIKSSYSRTKTNEK